MKYLVSLLAFLSIILVSCDVSVCVGECVNGDCDRDVCECFDGYGGDACDQLLTPKTITVESVTFENIPELGTGSNPWDPSDEPDLFVSVSNGGVVLTSEVINNSLEDITVTNLGTFDYDPTVGLSISLMDKDATSDDFMGGASLNVVNEETKEFSAVITWDMNFAATLSYTY